MSLAQKVERPNTGSVESFPRAVTRPMPVDFRDITRRSAPAALPATSQQVAALPVAAPEAGPASTSAGADVALALLNDVCTALPAAMERCEKLEADLLAARNDAKAEIDAANDVAREWQQIAGALKLQVEGLEKGLAAMKQRAEAAEHLASDTRDLADRSQHAAAEAECLASLFQEKVLASFGAGSRMQPLLENFRTKYATQAV